MKFQFPKAPRPETISLSDWSDWTWQLRASLKTKSDFAKWFNLTNQEEQAFDFGGEIFNIRTTPYYASLVNPNLSQDPLRRIFVPQAHELESGFQNQLDPLGERKQNNNPVNRVIHRYSDRALFLITDVCSVYCRFCTRKHFTGAEEAFIRNDDYQKAIQYFQKHTGLREVILSGGDPLTVSDNLLDRVLFDLRRIEHIEVIRLGTRMPVVAPMRVSESLAQLLRRHKPVYLMTHFNHPRELTEEAALAIERLVDHGVPVMNQMVLLNGVNNHPAIVQALSRRLLYLRAKPYYMFQCDPSMGTDHLRTSVANSLSIQKELWGHLSGLAMPHFAVDIPSGGGKAYHVPQFQIDQRENVSIYEGWDGVQADYVSPTEDKIMTPIDYESYLSEWENLKRAKLPVE